MDSSSSSSTNLDYFDDMWKLQSTATLLSLSEVGCFSTLFSPFLSVMFLSRENLQGKRTIFPSARQWSTCRFRRHRRCRFRHQIRSRRCAVQRRHSLTRPGICWMHTCMRNVGLGDLEPTKGLPFPSGDAEYKSTVPQKDIASKQKELKVEANALISRGGKDSIPRIVKLGDSIGCPCGGTRVSDISEIKSIMVVPMFLLLSEIKSIMVTQIWT